MSAALDEFRAEHTRNADLRQQRLEQARAWALAALGHRQGPAPADPVEYLAKTDPATYRAVWLAGAEAHEAAMALRATMASQPSSPPPSRHVQLRVLQGGRR